MSRSSMTQLLNEAQDLLVQTFSHEELRQLLRQRMELDLDAIAPNASGNTALVFELLTWMDRRRRVHELIRAACEERPTVPEWNDLVGKLPLPTGPGEVVTGAGGRDASRRIDPPDEVRALVRGYGRLRKVLPDGDQKTVQLQTLVNQLLELPLEEHGLADLFHLSESDGERLVAVLALVRRADTRYLRWLAERIAVEAPFVGYQAAVALEAAARTLPALDLDPVVAAINCAREWLPRSERSDKGRWKKLGQALDAVARRSAAARPIGDNELTAALAAWALEDLTRMVSSKLRESPEDIAAAAREPHLTGPVLLRWARERGRMGELRAAVAAWDRERSAG